MVAHKVARGDPPDPECVRMRTLCSRLGWVSAEDLPPGPSLRGSGEAHGTQRGRRWRRKLSRSR